jgi:hypothetical protein
MSKKKLAAWQGKKAVIIHTALKVALWQLTHDRNVCTLTPWYTFAIETAAQARTQMLPATQSR